MSDQHEETTLESIDAALDTLIKATAATDLIKGGVDTYGHVDERGKTKGGRAGPSDAGGLDRMMIGKMEASLIDQGFPAAAIAAFMAGKMDDEEEGEEEEEEEGKMSRDKDDDGDNPFGKSFDAFAEDPAIADAIDVSPFLEALVQRTSEQLDHLGKSQHAMSADQAEVNRGMAAAMYGIAQLVKGIDAVTGALNSRLALVERQPSQPRGVQGAPRARAMAKSFGGNGGEQPAQLTKSHVLNTLSYMNLEKGIREIGGQATSELIGLYEGGGQLAPQALRAAHQFLATHPNEAQVALTYR